MTNVKLKNELLEYLGVSWHRVGNSLGVHIYEPRFKIESLIPVAQEYTCHFEMDSAWKKVETLFSDYSLLLARLERMQKALNEYALHSATCAVNQEIPEPCTCGLAEALEEKP